MVYFKNTRNYNGTYPINPFLSQQKELLVVWQVGPTVLMKASVPFHKGALVLGPGWLNKSTKRPIWPRKQKRWVGPGRQLGGLERGLATKSQAAGVRSGVGDWSELRNCITVLVKKKTCQKKTVSLCALLLFLFSLFGFVAWELRFARLGIITTSNMDKWSFTL